MIGMSNNKEGQEGKTTCALTRSIIGKYFVGGGGAGRVMVVRTGRGGSEGIFGADDAHAVDAGLYPSTVALAL